MKYMAEGGESSGPLLEPGESFARCASLDPIVLKALCMEVQRETSESPSSILLP